VTEDHGGRGKEGHVDGGRKKIIRRFLPAKDGGMKDGDIKEISLGRGCGEGMEWGGVEAVKSKIECSLQLNTLLPAPGSLQYRPCCFDSIHVTLLAISQCMASNFFTFNPSIVSFSSSVYPPNSLSFI